MAARFWKGGGSSTNWDATANTNWAATSGGANNQTVPTSVDDVTFDSAGNSSSVIASIITIKSLTITAGYTATMTHNAVLTIAGSWTYVTGYTIAGSSDITSSAAGTITSNGVTWPNGLSMTGAVIRTLSGNLTIGGTLTLAGGVTINSNTLNCAGLTVTGNTLAGSTLVRLTSGTWTGTFNMRHSMTFAGNITVSGVVNFGATLNYSSGTITVASSTLTLVAATTMNTNGMSWNNITISASFTLTISSALSITGTFTVNAGVSPTFAGSSGFTTATFTCINTNNTTTITLVHAVTYVITTALTINSATVSSHPLITSDDGTIQAILTLNNGASNNLIADFTRIDASGGRAIWTFNGTVTTCNNIFAFNDMGAIQRINKQSATISY